MPGAGFIEVMRFYSINCVCVEPAPAVIVMAISHQFLRLLVSRSSLIRDDVVESELFWVSLRREMLWLICQQICLKILI